MKTTKKEQFYSTYLAWFCFWRNYVPYEKHESPSHKGDDHDNDQNNQIHVNLNNKKPGGWKSMPYIIGNETFERLAAFGLMANFMVYLKRQYHMDQVSATNFLNIYAGFANFMPLLGAFISDAYFGRFKVIAMGSFAVLLGMITLTLTSFVPNLKPQPCPINNSMSLISQQSLNSCAKPTSSQLWVLILSVGLLSVGSGCIRPCSIPFGVDQFDHSTEEGRRGIASYYNWYYTTFTVVVMIALTVIVYIQNSVSWVWGFTVPTSFMLLALVLFFYGARLYVHVQPEGSVFSSIFRVVVAAYKKRHLLLPRDLESGEYYDPPLTGIQVDKLILTNQFRFLSKAAIVLEGETNMDGTSKQTSKWTLCSIQQVEEVKCLIKVLPIWLSGIICFLAAAQSNTFTINQAMLMNKHLGRKFEIPPGSIATIGMLAIGIWVPFYDRCVVPILRKYTKREDGISLLQRVGIGLVMSTFAMVIAGLVEKKRRDAFNNHGKIISVWWLVPQLVTLGLAEAFNFIGQIEFYNKQFPENLRSMATSLFFCTIAGASYFNVVVVSLVHKTSGGHGKPDWLTNDLNEGRLDYFYYLIALLGVINVIYFLIVSKRYRYKETRAPKEMISMA